MSEPKFSRLNLKRSELNQLSNSISRTIQVTLTRNWPFTGQKVKLTMPSTGTLNVSLFDASRQPWQGPAVRVILTDPFTTSVKTIVNTTVPEGTHNVFISDIPTDAGQTYMLLVDADEHRDHAVFPVKPLPKTVTPVNIMLIPNDPVFDFGNFSYNLLQLTSPQFHSALSTNVPEAAFFDLADSDPEFGLARMATLLNIEAKLRATALKQGQAVDFIQRFNDVSSLEPDRLKVGVKPEMPANVKGLKTFNELPPELNELNHKGFPVSFKQKVVFCSLQLSYKKKPENGLLAADIDIDLLTDIGHFGEVIKNKITKTKTDPFTIYTELFDQNILPLYTLKI